MSLTFHSELVLHQAIAGLLERMPTVSQVQILQGAMEYGKDIVFCARGQLGEDTNCACVVKNKPITGKAGGSASSRTLIDQIEQALDTPYRDGRAQEVPVHKVYVMNPHQISPAALAAVAGRLRDRAGLVTFVTGPELHRLFLRHWPEYMADEHSYAKRLEDALAEAGGSSRAVLSLAMEYEPGLNRRGMPEIYVHPMFERVVNLYEVLPDVDMLLPPGRLGRSWTQSQQRGFASRLREHLSLIQFLSQWPFPRLNSLEESGADARMRRLLDGLHEELNKAFRQAKRRPRASSDEKFKPIEVQLPPEVSASLTQDYELLRDAAHLFWGEVRDTLRAVTRGHLPASIDSDSVLDDSAYTLACEIDDCVRAAPAGTAKKAFRVVDTRGYAFAEHIHRRRPQSLFIVGGPGSGKTSFCTRNALQDVREAEADVEALIPVYVPLHRLPAPGDSGFDAYFMPRLDVSAFLGGVSGDPSTRPKRIYLDGLDEVTDRDLRSAILTLVKQAPAQHPHCQIILTARDYLYDPGLTWLPRLRLGGLSDEGLASLAAGWLSDDQGSVEEFLTQIRQLPGVLDLVRVPLLAVVTVLVYKKTRRVPPSRSHLYGVFVNLLCGGWDLAKEILRPSLFSVDTKVQVLSSLASDVHDGGLREFAPTKVSEAARRVLSKRHPDDHEAILDELLRDGIIVKTVGQCHFAHLSFQEYLTARHHFGDPSTAKGDDIVRSYMKGDDWWREVAKFFIGMGNTPERTARWLLSQLPKRQENERAEVLWAEFSTTFPDFDLGSIRPQRQSVVGAPGVL